MRECNECLLKDSESVNRYILSRANKFNYDISDFEYE